LLGFEDAIERFLVLDNEVFKFAHVLLLIVMRLNELLLGLPSCEG